MTGELVRVKDYWPFDLPKSNLRRFDYKDPTGSMPPITSVFAWDKGTGSLLYVDYDAHLTWKDTWYMNYDHTQGGVIEWRDDYPHGKKVVMSGVFGRPIGWGDVVTIGSSSVNYPKMNPFESWPPATAGGVQALAFEALMSSLLLTDGTVFQNVLQFSYLQSWDGKPATGARYFMAYGVGPVAVQWIAQDPTNPTGKPLIETARMDATVSEVSTALVS